MTNNSQENLRENAAETDSLEKMKRDRYFSSFGLILTEKCNIKCRHCFFDCNPNSTYDLKINKIAEIIQEAKKIDGLKIIGFTGGEPFLELDKLSKSVGMCKNANLASSVVTNGFWANTIDETTRIFQKLDGLTKIAISTDIFHQEFVPIQNVRNIISVAHDFKIECHVRISYLDNPDGEINNVRNQLDGLKGKYILSGQPVQASGRAAIQIDEKKLYTYNAMKTACTAADTILILASGEVMSCCGPQDTWTSAHPLCLGNIHHDSLAEIWVRADNNPIIHIIRLWGPSKLISIIQDQAKKDNIILKPPTIEEKQDICALCKYALDNQKHANLLEKALSNKNLKHNVAANRFMKLGEPSMILREK